MLNKNLFHPLILLTINLLSTSCNNNIEAEKSFDSTEAPLYFINTLNTKAITIDNENIETYGDRTHGVFIYKHQSGEPFNPNISRANYGFNIPSTYNEKMNRWEVRNDIGWPLDGGRLSFVTYYPIANISADGGVTGGRVFGLGEDATRFSIISDQAQVGSPTFRYDAGNSVLNHQDILIGDSYLNSNSLINNLKPIGNGSVPFQFKHITSSIVFAKNVVDINVTDSYAPTSDFEFDIVKITISGLHNSGNFIMDSEENLSSMEYPYILKTPVIWSELSGANESQFELNSGEELIDTDDQNILVIGQTYDITSQNGAVMIPPQNNLTNLNQLKISVEANIKERVGDRIVVIFTSMEFTPDTFNFDQGKRTKFLITYNYQAPVTGSLTLDGDIVPWNKSNVTVLPYF